MKLLSMRNITLALAAVGFIVAVGYSAASGRAKEETPHQIALPPATPFSHTVSGIGLVEASSRNIEVGSFLSGIVATLYVKEGATVKQGEPLFSLDSRLAKAAVDEARAAYNDTLDQWNRTKNLKKGVVVSDERRQRIFFAAERAHATLQHAQTLLDQMTVPAPSDGRILKVRIRPGEFVSAGGEGERPILMGQDNPLYLRVDIDENDAWRFSPESKALAYLRSNKNMSFKLKYVTIEPYVQPKQSLSGGMTERVDTRVLQVIYEIDAPKFPVYIGQQLDVFIEAEAG